MRDIIAAILVAVSIVALFVGTLLLIGSMQQGQGASIPYLSGLLQPVGTSSVPQGVRTGVVPGGGQVIPINVVATQDRLRGIIYTPLPTETPRPRPTSTPLPTFDPATLICVATIEALPGYPTPYPSPYLSSHVYPIEYQKTSNRITLARWYLLRDLPGEVVASGKKSPNDTNETKGLFDFTLEGYEVIEVTPPCSLPINSDVPGVPARTTQKFWRVQVSATGGPNFSGAAIDRYVTCIDNIPLWGGINFDPSLMHEGATISFGYSSGGYVEGMCDAKFAEKLHLRKVP